MAHFCEDPSSSDAELLCTPAGLRPIAEAATEAVHKVAAAIASRCGGDDALAFVDDTAIRALIENNAVEAMASASVVGGVLGSEVVKVLTGRGEPHCNVIVFDCMGTGAAVTAL